MTLDVGTLAPEFSLQDQDKKTHNLADYTGKWVLLYFYPKDMTPGCTIEACTLRDVYAEFKKANAAVLGVSADSALRHKKFADRDNLPFPLLSDESREMLEAYGVWAQKKMMGREYMGILRMSFLIDPDGKIAKVYEKVKPKEHAGEVLQDLKELQQ